MASRIAPTPSMPETRQASLRRSLDRLWDEFRTCPPSGPGAWALAEHIEALQESLWALDDHGTQYHPFLLLVNAGTCPPAQTGVSPACPH